MTIGRVMLVTAVIAILMAIRLPLLDVSLGFFVAWGVTLDWLFGLDLERKIHDVKRDIGGYIGATLGIMSLIVSVCGLLFMFRELWIATARK